MATAESQEPQSLLLSDVSTILPVPDICVEEEDDDIYRGLPDDQPSPAVISNIPQLPPRPESSASGRTSASSSSGWSVSGRLGALAAVVENAITRWARRNSSSSSINTSTSSSSSVSRSTSIQTKSTRKRSRRYSADHNARSERDIRARIRARQETRRTPRGFSLYVPPQLRTSRTSTSISDPVLQYDEQGVLRTHLLPTVLNRVYHALRLSEKLRQPERPIQRANRNATVDSAVGVVTQDRDQRAGKGKQRDPSKPPRERVPRPIPEGAVGPEKVSWPSWWLDVSSPTYADMKALGKLLHLHPLTLEDILQQDPREKMELFPKLGYYFIVFKAIESERTRDRLDRLARRSVDSLPSAKVGVIAEDVIYLVVLRDGRGICTFHFTDISEHLDRVREKVLLLDENANKSSDWIAHGMLDSVVDSFFPVLAQIDKEVDQIEKVLYFGPAISENVMKAGLATPKPSSDSTSDSIDEKGDDASTSAKDEKPSFSPIISQQRIKTAKFRAPPLPVSLHIRRARRFLKSLFSNTSTATGAGEPWIEEVVNPATRTVYRMAKIRRLVTTLTRLLSTKADLIGQIQKRLVTRGEWSLDSDPELYIHMGDILDHILTLQQALAHHEWTLAQSHPIYLTQLDVQAAQTKAGRGKAAVILAVVGVAVVLEGVPIGLSSVNVTIPTNGHAPQYPLYLFGAVIAVEVVITSVFLMFVRRIWRDAKKRTQKRDF
ncbi:hypothetical protein BJ322DRAFT_1107254 [Thelephora terrestris]|uniref:Magnesium transporter n=1 Tax=Thelephora terrestris TaxID=56493 RepID=A0A9P6HH79_9AGAM|nr:hypothetical protein BJ322DRAFT_1107254 [Thelephora terrestris]